MKKLNDLLGSVEKTIASIFLLLTTTVAFFQVLNRHIFHIEIMGLGDICIYAYMICLFFAFAFASKEGMQTAVEIIQNKIADRSAKAGTYYAIVMDLFSIAVVVTFLLPLYTAVKKAARYPEWGTLIRWFNQSWLMYILFFTFCLSLFHMLFILWQKLRAVK